MADEVNRRLALKRFAALMFGVAAVSIPLVSPATADRDDDDDDGKRYRRRRSENRRRYAPRRRRRDDDDDD